MKSGDAFDDDAGGDDAHSRVSCHTITTAYPEGELGSPTVGRSRKSSMAEGMNKPNSFTRRSSIKQLKAAMAMAEVTNRFELGVGVSEVGVVDEYMPEDEELSAEPSSAFAAVLSDRMGMAVDPSLDVLQREASESPRSLLLPAALLAQRRAVIRATSRMDEGSKLKINTLIVKCEESLKVPPGRRSRRNLLPLLLFAESALASYALSDVQKVRLAQCMTLETYAPGSYVHHMGAAANGFGIVLYGLLTVHQPAAMSPSKSHSRRASRRTDATSPPMLSPSSSVKYSAQRSLSKPDKESRLSWHTAPLEQGWQDNGPDKHLPLMENAEGTKSKRVSRKGAVLSRESSLGSPRTPRIEGVWHPSVIQQESLQASSPKFRLASLLRKAKAVNAFQRLQLDALDSQADIDPGERPIPLDRDVDSGLWECTGELIRKQGFGQLMVLDGATHNDTVRAEQHAAVIVISKEDLQSITNSDQRESFQDRVNFLQKLSCMKGVTPAKLIFLNQLLNPHERPANTVLWSEGDAVEQVYLIHEGEWCIHRSIQAHSKTGASQGQRVVQVCTMNGPAFAGDMELLLGESEYSCTCVTKTHTVYYSLHYKDFLQIPSQVLERLHSLAQARRTFIDERARALERPGAVGAQLRALRDAPALLEKWDESTAYTHKLYAHLHESRVTPTVRQRAAAGGGLPEKVISSDKATVASSAQLPRRPSTTQSSASDVRILSARAYSHVARPLTSLAMASPATAAAVIANPPPGRSPGMRRSSRAFEPSLRGSSAAMHQPLSRAPSQRGGRDEANAVASAMWLASSGGWYSDLPSCPSGSVRGIYTADGSLSSRGSRNYGPRPPSGQTELVPRATTAPHAAGPRNPPAVAAAHYVIAPPRMVGFIKREHSARTTSNLQAKQGTRGGGWPPAAPAMHVEMEPVSMLRNTRELLSVSNSQLACSWDDYAAAPSPPRRATKSHSQLQSVREQNSDLNVGMAAPGAAHDGSPSGLEGMHLTFVRDGDASTPQPRTERPFLPIRMPTVKAQANRYSIAARNNIRRRKSVTMRAQVGGHRLPEATPAANQLAEALHNPGVRRVGKESTRIRARPPGTGPRSSTPAQKWTSYSCLDDDDRLMHL